MCLLFISYAIIYIGDIMIKNKVNFIIYGSFVLVIGILIGIWFINSTCAIVTQLLLPIVLTAFLFVYLYRR